MTVVSFPARFESERDPHGAPERSFEADNGSRVSAIHSPDGSVMILAGNPHAEALAIVPPDTARRFARAILAEADKAESAPIPDFMASDGLPPGGA